VATGQVPPAGLSPARTATSIAARTFSTLFCDSFLRCLSPYHGGPTECSCLVLPQRHRPSPGVDWSASRFFPRTRFSTDKIFEAAAIPLCSGLQVCLPPGSLLPLQGFPAGQLRRLHPSRTCVVTFARIGYASRPTTGNWRHEDFHLARLAALSTAPSTAFPPHSPPTMFRLCSNDSSVVCRCVTPRGRICGPCGYCLRPPPCGLVEP
jgi:hypothetical protein